jgi:SAM-dependent methyltransferase
VVEILRRETGLTGATIIADIGAGTGIATALFLRQGNTVFAVEPNREMRIAAEQWLGTFPGFHSVAGRAEATTLPDHSVDCVLAAQAFHWFEPERARSEFRRILRAGGWVVLLWNRRLKEATPFLRAYETLLEKHGVDYAQVRHEGIDDAALAAFFAPGFGRHSLPHAQVLDFDSLRGGLLSSSYAPRFGHPAHAPILAMLRRIFDEHQQDGRVRLDYETVVYHGRV